MLGVAERREREREERRAQIIDAAERVFRDRGAVDATMADVAAEAELSKGTLYLYFKSKDELYLAIATRSLQLLVERIDGLPEAPTGLAEIAQKMQVQREVARQYPMRFQAVLAWIVSGFRADPDSPAFAEYQALTQHMFRGLGAAIRRGQQDGSIRSDVQAPMTGMHLWGGTMGVWALYFNQSEVARRLPDAGHFDTMVDTFAATLLRGIAADADAIGDDAAANTTTPTVATPRPTPVPEP